MSYESGHSDSRSKLYHDTKDMIERDLLRVLSSYASYVQGIKLVEFKNLTGQIVASVIVVMDETMFINKTDAQFNSTAQNVSHALMNGQFQLFDIDRTHDFDIKCKFRHLFSLCFAFLSSKGCIVLPSHTLFLKILKQV